MKTVGSANPEEFINLIGKYPYMFLLVPYSYSYRIGTAFFSRSEARRAERYADTKQL